MPSRTTRHFQLVDALVLVAAAAVGLAGGRAVFSESSWATGNPWDLLPGPVSTFEGLRRGAVWSIPIASAPLLSATMAILLLRLRNPRPRRGCLWRQPGLLACSSVMAAFAWNLVGLLSIVAPELLMAGLGRTRPVNYGEIAHDVVQLLLGMSKVTPQCAVLPANVGLAVLVAWMTAWAGRRCRPEASWVDRAGRALGIAWILLALLGFAGIVA